MLQQWAKRQAEWLEPVQQQQQGLEQELVVLQMMQAQVQWLVLVLMLQHLAVW
jgi:hypothetical protein